MSAACRASIPSLITRAFSDTSPSFFCMFEESCTSPSFFCMHEEGASPSLLVTPARSVAVAAADLGRPATRLHCCENPSRLASSGASSRTTSASSVDEIVSKSVVVVRPRRTENPASCRAPSVRVGETCRPTKLGQGSSRRYPCRQVCLASLEKGDAPSHHRREV